MFSSASFCTFHGFLFSYIAISEDNNKIIVQDQTDSGATFLERV